MRTANNLRLMAAVVLVPMVSVGGQARAEDTVNVALASNGATALADSIYRNEQPYAAANAIDGKWIGPGDPPDKNRTSFGTYRPHPHWLWIHFRQPASVSRVVLHRADLCDYPVNFCGEYSTDGGVSFKTLFEVTNNKMGRKDFVVQRSFEPVVTDNFRLRIIRSSLQGAPNQGQISEVEVFGNFVKAKPSAAPVAATATLPRRVLTPTASDGLDIKENDKEITFRSKWLRLAVARGRPQITAFSWDNLGQGNVDQNLLRAGETLGGQLTAQGSVFSPAAAIARSAPVERQGNVVRYAMEFSNGMRARWEMRVEAKSLRMAIGWANPATVAHERPARSTTGLSIWAFQRWPH